MNQRPYTTRAQKALALANAAAADLGDQFIGTEHLLLGLIDEKMGPAAQMLVHLGVSRDIDLDEATRPLEAVPLRRARSEPGC